ncbi:pur operon repressor [Lottiidibacillus patelloidae]|uniref:Pur operon repressor n=1 Tax=Lottiidibacillus patelloidae TaxID=2670334 RepID=A0A263BQ33_9BACI|nr:pur operon repressor [Lottiidibacillus patelloidae]OZM55849.1 pur operon repressor [Lottiidibacillus patelloidae]
MKLRRSARLVDMTRVLLDQPHELISLSYFSERYQSAKSSISEDLGIIKSSFEHEGIGTLKTVAGAAGGVLYIPLVNQQEASTVISDLKETVANSERLLPGGYLFMTDILGDSRLMKKIGRLYASIFADRKIDVVMTVATKGIPFAYSIASFLNVPVVIVRRDTRVTEGSTVSINYVSGSQKRIQTMVLSRRSLKTGSNVLIVDDFMKAGGTISGMVSLLNEFQAKVAGIGVLIEAQDKEAKLINDYVSLVKVDEVDETSKQISVTDGNYKEFLTSGESVKHEGDTN